MAEPFIKTGSIHGIGLLHSLTEGGAYRVPLLLDFKPLLIIPCTKEISFAVRPSDTTLTLPIKDSYKYSKEKIDLWSVPIKSYRLFDLSAFEQSQVQDSFAYDFENNPQYSAFVQKIADAIKRYNIVYLKNPTRNYPIVISNVHSQCTSK